jgi:hypothetical protein
MPELRDPTDALLDRSFLFRDRPASAPSDLRPVWRVPVVTLLVSSCRSKKATHEQLHVLNWATRSFASAERLAAFMAGDTEPERAIVRFEPALDRATALARGLGLLNWDERYWVLNAAGQTLLEAVWADDELLVHEKSLLTSLPNPLTQAQVGRLLSRATS